MTDLPTKPLLHNISVLVNNKPGVLIRVALVFARRGYNIDSLVVSPAHDPAFSRITIVAEGDKEAVVQILRQVNKLVDVVHAIDHTDEAMVVRELALIKIGCRAEERTEVLQLAEHFRGQTVDIAHESVMLQVTGGPDKINALMLLLEKFDIQEVVRTGKVLMARGLEST